MSDGELVRSPKNQKRDQGKTVSINSVLKNKDFIQTEKESTGFRGGSYNRKQRYLLAVHSLLASFIDACTILITLLLMSAVSLFVFNHFQTENFFLLKQDVITLFSFLYIGFALFYLIFMRLLIGQTLGEWTCGLYLGYPKQRLAKNYAVKVLARSLLVFASGIVFLPLINLIFAYDLAGKICQLSLVSKKI